MSVPVSSQVLRATPGVWIGAAVQLAAELSTGQYRLILVDAVAAPPLGPVVPKFSWLVTHTIGTQDELTIRADIDGTPMAAGAVLLLSSASDDSTYEDAGAYMTAQTTE